MTTRCVIAGGGPAGAMLGLLLARAGIDVIVLEKHADFLRDFRGDTVHPSTMEVLHELGLLEAFLQRPHQEMRTISAQIGDERMTLADFSHLPTVCRFVALMPQWDFLDFLTAEAARYPTFTLKMRAEVVDLLREGDRVTGVVAGMPDGPLAIHADLTVGADGRRSVVREQAGLVVESFGAPIDVLWMRLPRRPDDGDATFGHVRDGRMFVMLNRGDYWQCALAIPKGGYDEVRRLGLPAFRHAIAAIVPFLRDRVGELREWDDVKLLTVMVDRLREWQRPGLLCIGDAAHAMSPIGGVGINLAIQDAVAAANLLAAPLRRGGPPSLAELRAVQQRRLLPTRLTQAAQVFIHHRVLGPTIAGHGGGIETSLPLPLRLLRDHPRLRRVAARLVGLGVRPEHVRLPHVDVASSRGVHSVSG